MTSSPPIWSHLVRIAIVSLLWIRSVHAGNVLAVMYFDIQSEDTRLQRLRVGLAEMMTTDLARVDGFEVVERKELAALLAEQDLGASGRIDQSTAVEIGQLLGAHYMVFGSGFDLFGTLRLDVRVVDVETGAIVSTGSAEGPPKELIEMKGTLVESISTWMMNQTETGQVPTDVSEPAHATMAAADSDPTGAAVAFAEGLELLDSGDIPGAQNAFSKAIEADARLETSVQHALNLATKSNASRGMGAIPHAVGAHSVPSKGEVYSRSHALVIGIDQYQHLNPLNGAVRDAKALAELLENRGFEVTLLLNEQATKTEIDRQLLGELPKNVGKNDRFLIYFAGHGVPEGRGDESRGYLMPVEAAESWQGLAMDNVMKELRVRYKARHILYLADACYSGLGLSTRAVPQSSDLPGYLRKVSEAEVQLQFTAGGKGQQANEYTGRRGTHGLFTYHLLDGLEGAADANDDGIVTSAELWPYLQQHVAGTAEQEGWNQTPQYGREGEGEFLFFLPD